jgi:hypothetical protein
VRSHLRNVEARSKGSVGRCVQKWICSFWGDAGRASGIDGRFERRDSVEFLNELSSRVFHLISCHVIHNSNSSESDVARTRLLHMIACKATLGRWSAPDWLPLNSLPDLMNETKSTSTLLLLFRRNLHSIEPEHRTLHTYLKRGAILLGH